MEYQEFCSRFDTLCELNESDEPAIPCLGIWTNSWTIVFRMERNRDGEENFEEKKDFRSLIFFLQLTNLEQKHFRFNFVRKNNKQIIKMVKQCTLKNCKNEWQPNTNVSYHGFPMKNAPLLAKWMKAIPPELIRTPTKYTSICSVHFPPECFDTKPMNRLINRLKKDAVPSIFDNYDKCTDLVEDYLMDMLISSEDSDAETLPEINCKKGGANFTDTHEVRMNFEIVKKNGCERNIGVQTSSKRFKPSEKEKELKRQIALLQKRLERRDTKIKSLTELVYQLKKHVAAVQNSKLKFTGVSQLRSFQDVHT